MKYLLCIGSFLGCIEGFKQALQPISRKYLVLAPAPCQLASAAILVLMII